MSNQKLRVIKDYVKLDKEIQEQIKLAYPNGFSEHLITFTNKDGDIVSALPFETEDRYYLVRMTKIEAKDIIRQDDDYDEDGNLKEESRVDFEDKYTELDYLADRDDDIDDDVDVEVDEVDDIDDDDD